MTIELWKPIYLIEEYEEIKPSSYSTGEKKPDAITGEVLEFESVKEATLSGEFKRKGIWRATSGETPRYKNYKWEFI